MKRKIMAVLMILALVAALAACSKEEEKETTLTGMVVSVDGTVISLMEMDLGNLGNRDFADGERPQMPEGMEDFQGFGGFNPEDFEGSFPEGGGYPQWGGGEMPEGMTPPAGMPTPGSGEMPDFGGMGGMDFGNFASNAETKDVDIGNAHISVEIDGDKASGSMDDIKAGTFVTITMNGKGEVTRVLVSSQSAFGGWSGMTPPDGMEMPENMFPGRTGEG